MEKTETQLTATNENYLGDFVFSEPLPTFQKCLPEILELCLWKKRDFANILGVSMSTVNNILGNESMTNSRQTTLSRPQFISILCFIQQLKSSTSNVLIFYMFSWLCAGLSKELDFNKFNKIAPLEGDLEQHLLYKNIDNLFPGLIRTFNEFIKWRTECPEKEFKDFMEHPENDEHIFYVDENPCTESEINYAIENIKKFIPRYLDWYIDKIAKKEMLH